MSAPVRSQSRVIGIPTEHSEVLPVIEGNDGDGEECSAEMGNGKNPLPKIDGQEMDSLNADETSTWGRGGNAPAAERIHDGDLWLYRDRTVVLLKHYARMAVESGRLPSLLGRECFGTRVTPYAMASFEDMAIFVHDMGAAMRKLNDLQQRLITLNVLEEFSQWEIAHLLGCTTRWIEWQVSDALDELTRGLVACGLVRGACQERRKNESAVSDSNEGKNIC